MKNKLKKEEVNKLKELAGLGEAPKKEKVLTVGALIKLLSKHDQKSPVVFNLEIERGRGSTFSNNASWRLDKEGNSVVFELWGDESDFD